MPRCLVREYLLNEIQYPTGHRILIYGASGAIGKAAVQLAKIYGADVTAVVSISHIELAAKLGADHVVDYTTEDFTKIGERFDFVLDAVGKTSYFQCRELIKPEGIYSATDLGPWWQNVILAAWSSITGSGRVVFPIPRNRQSFIKFIAAQIESANFNAVIDRAYSLTDIAEAYRYVETEQKSRSSLSTSCRLRFGSRIQYVKSQASKECCCDPYRFSEYRGK